MERLFTELTHAVEGVWWLGLTGAFLWGVVSIVLSPCHLASIPLVVGVISQQKDGGARRSLYISLVFSLGIMLTIGAVGAVTAMAGRLMGDVGPMGTYVVGAVFVVFGLVMMGVVNIPWLSSGQFGAGSGSLGAAFVLGLIFGIAVGPCTFAYMAPMLAVVFECASENAVYAVSLVMLYAVGHCGVIVGAGVSSDAVGRYLGWHERSQIGGVLKKAVGGIIVLCGLYLLYKA
ncbi:thiol:disulfide interchange protein precursor [Anaerohalosphaera lusitana]|uniref:Thiol:disulfide interchange protein n=1 Tax=Anaerohalosphaera lusitana TaxID=1936003 RepID=A0A1U9NGT5_9BACT|nr:cytochrome c biogenesis protein CcdA [Anaerohalosphaera lusitana]AQT67139.1 thiol:disulfide interchange protein precursor [Anaerohalosphaera lusitana]